MLIFAIFVVPYNLDSMLYHLPRIVFWSQNHCVNHFAVEDTRIVASSILAEYFNLHIFLFYHTYNLFNILQCFSYLICTFLVYYLSLTLGLNKKYSLFSMLTFISIPIVFAESLTTQVDLFASIFMILFVIQTIKIINTEKCKSNNIFEYAILGVVFGLGYVAKQSVSIGTFIFSFGLLLKLLIDKNNIFVLLPKIFVAIFCMLIIIFPMHYRNFMTFGACFRLS